MGKILIWIGIVLIAVGILIHYADRFNIGRLPGDIKVERENFSFYFPITTSILISLLVSLILYFINRSKS